MSVYRADICRSWIDLGFRGGSCRPPVLVDDAAKNSPAPDRPGPGGFTGRARIGISGVGGQLHCGSRAAPTFGTPNPEKTPFVRDGVAAEYAAVPAGTLTPKPSRLSHVESAAVPLPGLSAWQACSRTAASSPASGCSSTEQSVVSAGSRPSWRAGAAHTSSQPRRRPRSRKHAHSALTRWSTAGGSSATGSARSISSSTRSAASSSIARRPCSRAAAASSRSPGSRQGKGSISSWNRTEPAGRTGAPHRHRRACVAIDSTFPLSEATAAFERSLASGERGKVVIRVAGEGASGAAAGGGG